MGPADDVERLFLQALISRRVVTKALARILLKKCVEAVKGPSSPYSWRMRSNVAQLQKGTWISGSQITTIPSTRSWSISTYLWTNSIWRLSLSWMGSRETKSTYWFVRVAIRLSPYRGTDVLTTQANRKGDEIAQVASDYSPAELAYFKVLVRLYCVPLLISLRYIYRESRSK